MQLDVEGGIEAKTSNKLVCKAPKILNLSLRQKVELLNSYNKIIISVLCGELKSRPV